MQTELTLYTSSIPLQKHRPIHVHRLVKHETFVETLMLRSSAWITIICTFRFGLLLHQQHCCQTKSLLHF